MGNIKNNANHILFFELFIVVLLMLFTPNGYFNNYLYCSNITIVSAYCRSSLQNKEL